MSSPMFCAVGLYIILCICVCVRCQSLYVQGNKNCASTCVRIEHCQVAQELLVKKNEASRQQLKDAFCGRDAQQEVVICCDELLDVLDGHPNLALLPQECGQSKGHRIVGGDEAALKEFPWMVLLSYRTHGDLDFQCGGTLITDRYVLTAAHCITDLAPKILVGVRVGEHNIVTEKDCQLDYPLEICVDHLQDIRVEQVIPHEHYVGQVGRLRNDIGLIRLNKPVDLSHSNIGLVCLPRTRALRTVTLANGTVTGWGVTDSGRSSDALMKVKLRVYSEQDCSSFHNRGSTARQETVNKLCAGEEGKDSCRGDSGGPLMASDLYLGKQSYVQQGIVSFGPVKCGSRVPGVYTRVGPYMKWILDNIKP